MKKELCILTIILLSYFVSSAQNANFIFQILIQDSEGNLKEPVDDYSLSEENFEFRMEHLGNHCVKTFDEATFWYIMAGYSFVSIDLDAFSDCGGWVGGDQIMMTVIIKKMGSPLNGKSGSCIFSANTGDLFEGKEGIVISLNSGECSFNKYYLE